MPNWNVEALHYSLRFDERVVDYEVAPSVTWLFADYNTTIDDGSVTFHLKRRFSESKDAQEFVQPFIERWEASEALKRGSLDWFQLIFDRADVVDLDQEEGSTNLMTGSARMTFTGHAPTVHVGMAAFPEPPSEDFLFSPDAAVMLDRYLRFRKGETLLGDTANFCLTVMESRFQTSKRKAASKHYRISKPLLDVVARLCASAGGADARKADGHSRPWTNEEQNWLLAALPLIIDRVSRVNGNPTQLPQVTMRDLPPIDLTSVP